MVFKILSGVKKLKNLVILVNFLEKSLNKNLSKCLIHLENGF